jgi:hypothetical protein
LVELRSEFHSAAGRDVAIDQNVNVVDGDFAEQMWIVRDHHNAYVGLICADAADTVCDSR